MDTLLSMRVFTRIVETGSFTRASDTTGLTTPRVSALLSALEQHLGCRLLNRTTRRIALTEDGQAYYERCVAVLREIDDMEASVSDARDAPRGRLKVNLPPAMAKQIMVPALPAFLAAHPGIMIELGVTDRQIDLVGEGVDCVVRVGALDDSGLIAKRIGSLTTCTCASPPISNGSAHRPRWTISRSMPRSATSPPIRGGRARGTTSSTASRAWCRCAARWPSTMRIPTSRAASRASV